MERLRQIWTNYKEGVPIGGINRQYSKNIRRLSVSSDGDSSDKYQQCVDDNNECVNNYNKKNYDIDKVNIVTCWTNCVCVVFFVNFRSEMNQLQSNVEKLSNKIIVRDNNLRTENNYNVNQDFTEGILKINFWIFYLICMLIKQFVM